MRDVSKRFPCAGQFERLVFLRFGQLVQCDGACADELAKFALEFGHGFFGLVGLHRRVDDEQAAGRARRTTELCAP